MSSRSSDNLYLETHKALNGLLQTLKVDATGEQQRKILPEANTLRAAQGSLVSSLPTDGTGADAAIHHILNAVVPGLNLSSLSPNYYGFVTGGSTEAAGLADQISSLLDQNVAVHLPQETVSTVVEDRALEMLLELFDFESSQWSGRTFTTGATASNVVGLACAREGVLETALRRTKGRDFQGIGQVGIVTACLKAGLSGIQILSTAPHSSLRKAASILGLGRDSVVDVGSAEEPWLFDFARLEEMLSDRTKASIVAISCGEINTGRFATRGIEEFQKLRALCDEHEAWIHVDGAFGIFGRLLQQEQYSQIKAGCEGLELADSIGGDAHKLLNVPYDCGFVFCRSLDLMQQVFGNPNAAYLSSGPSGSDVPSPSNIGVENSRRFRALPVYATLMAYGKSGYQQMIERQVCLARKVVRYLSSRPQDFEVLPFRNASVEEHVQNTYMIVLFRAKNPDTNQELVRRIKESRRIYVSGTVWEGHPAARIAVSNWNADPDRDIRIIHDVLDDVVGHKKIEMS